jgi:hypothetical protein
MSALWSLSLAALALVVTGLSVWLLRRVVPARRWALFRSLLPAWRFFERVEPMPGLHYRFAPHGDDWSDWRDALTVSPRTLSSLWLNAAHNLHLAQESLIEHLASDLEEAAERDPARDELVSYRLVCAWVEQCVRAPLPPSPALRYQFRLVDAQPGAAPLFLSRVFGSE